MSPTETVVERSIFGPLVRSSDVFAPFVSTLVEAGVNTRLAEETVDSHATELSQTETLSEFAISPGYFATQSPAPATPDE